MPVPAPSPTAQAADLHTRGARAAAKRVDALEERLVEILQPILEQAGARAASRFTKMVTNHLTAAALRDADAAALTRIPAYEQPGGFGYRLRPVVLTAAAAASDSTMIALKPYPEEAAALQQQGGEPADTLHVTLAYLGSTEGDLEDVRAGLAAVAASHAPLAGVIGGVGRFEPPGVAILLPDVPGLIELRVAVTEALVDAGAAYGRDHGFEAHITIDAKPDPETLMEALTRTAQQPVHFDALLVIRGDEVLHEIPLVGPRPLTAAGEHVGWTPPAADELIDVDQLVGNIRAKTDPVRNALVETAMTATLKEAGVSFDVTNPLTKKVLSQAGSQVKGIAATTQLNVMRIIDRSYTAGLSITDTAKAIRAGMTASSESRARLIARTELAGAANGGSLAAAQIASDALGALYKIWLTAPGAPHPRHEEYEGLDGQTVALDDPFDVGGEALQFPGDPAGDPGEVCNCVVGSTVVRWPRLRAVTRRWYEGDLVRVRLASGDELAATPNHPVLGRDGAWLPISSVKVGDDLVRAAPFGETVGAPDQERPPAEIAELYQLANDSGVSKRVVVSPGDFHGDALVNGEVDVVALDGVLLLDVEAATDQQVTQLGFALAAAARTGTRRGEVALLDGYGRELCWSAAAGVMGGVREGEALFTAQFRQPEPVSVGASADRQAQSSEAPDDDVATDIKRSRDSQHAVAAVVSLAEVIQVDRLPFHGFVYNLDTGEGWYEAASLASGNCRCALAYTETAPVDVTGGTPGAGLSEAGVSDSGAAALADALPETPPPGDTVSVMTAPFVRPDVVERIQATGLDAPLRDLKPTSTVGQETFAAAPTTEGLYKVGGAYMPDGTYVGGAWTPAREAVHQDIVAAHFEGRAPPPKDEKPTAVFTAGGSASGKGSSIIDIGDRSFPLEDLEADAARLGDGPEHEKLVAQGDEWAIRHEAKYPDVILMNPDIIKEMLPEYEKLRNAHDLYAASGVHEESSAIGKTVARLAQEQGYNVVIDTTGASSSFVGKLEQAAKDGYTVKVRMSNAATNEAIMRAMARGDRSGRYVSTEALKGAHRGASAQLAIWKDLPSVTDWKVYDSTGAVPGAAPTLVAVRADGLTTVYDEEKFKAILAKANEVTAAPGSAFGKAAEATAVDTTAVNVPEVLRQAEKDTAKLAKALQAARIAREPLQADERDMVEALPKAVRVQLEQAQRDLSSWDLATYEERLAAEASGADWYARLASLIEKQPVTTLNLYRALDRAPAGVTDGSTIHVPISDWSRDAETATQYGDHVLVLESSRSLDVRNIDNDPAPFDRRLTGGDVQIDRIEEVGGQTFYYGRMVNTTTAETMRAAAGPR